MLSVVAERFDVPRKRRRELCVDQKAQSCAPQDRVVVLLRRELQDGGEILRLEVGVIREDLLARGAGSHEIAVIVGIVASTASALVLARVLAGLLYGITPTDPVSFLLGSVGLLSLTLVDNYIPAKRAARIDPIGALRTK